MGAIGAVIAFLALLWTSGLIRPISPIPVEIVSTQTNTAVPTETRVSEPTATDTPVPPTFTPTHMPTSTSLPTPTPVVIVKVVTATYTPEPTFTSTPTAEPTSTNTPTPRPTSTSTPTPTPRPTSTPTPTRVPVPRGYGPVGDTIAHDPDDGFVESHISGVNLADVVVEARFFNPYPLSVGSWSYGFVIRRSSAKGLHAIVIRSNGNWYHILGTGVENPYERLRKEPFSGIDTSTGGNNQVRVIALGDEGWVFINGEFAGKLDLSGSTKPGDVAALGTWFPSDDVEGEATVFQDFGVWAIDDEYGPVGDTIAHDPDDEFVESHISGVNLTNVVVEARFFNPYPLSVGSWSYGFLIRRSNPKGLHAIVIRSNGNWYHTLGTGVENPYERLRKEPFSGIDTSTGGNNQVRVIALGDEGWVFINGEFAGKLDLSGSTKPGDVWALGTWFPSDDVEGEATVFQDFGVWALKR